MCVAMPGKILSIEGTTARVDFSGNILSAELGLVNASVGDAVLIHAGCVIQVLPEEESAALFDLFRELEDAADEEPRHV